MFVLNFEVKQLRLQMGPLKPDVPRLSSLYFQMTVQSKYESIIQNETHFIQQISNSFFFFIRRVDLLKYIYFDL